MLAELAVDLREGSYRPAPVRRVEIPKPQGTLSGWGNYFRTGNASTKFPQVDDYVDRRLRDLLRRRHGRHLRPAHWQTWTREWFETQGLYRLRGTIRYPAPAS
jgi:RNA-directed DNA polymerase